MTLERAVERLEAAIGSGVDRGRSLATLTTYRVGGEARYYVEPRTADELVRIAEILGDEAEEGPLPVLVVGRGSNLVVSDEGWPGLAVRLGDGFVGAAEEDAHEDWVRMRAGAATPLPQLANWALRRGLTGMEFTVSIPGSVGGAVRMNAGAHGDEIARTLDAAEILDWRTGSMEQRPASSLDLAYRHSNIGPHEIVVGARFDLPRDDATAIKQRMEEFRRHRAETQPGALQNAGSVFKNPDGDHAGRLVEAAGLKGHRVGRVAVSSLHANFFIAEEGATAQEVYDLVHDVRRRVRAAFDVELEPEIRFVGRFQGARDHEEVPG